MVALDIRQESTRHTDALDAITTFLGMGSYKCGPPHARAAAQAVNEPEFVVPMGLYLALRGGSMRPSSWHLAGCTCV